MVADMPRVPHRRYYPLLLRSITLHAFMNFDETTILLATDNTTLNRLLRYVRSIGLTRIHDLLS